MENSRIKFRAWNTQKNVMHTSKNSYVRFDGNVHIHVKDPWNDAVDDKYIVLMQYTGLKDKYGVEIYEGDIFKSLSMLGVITKKEGCWIVDWAKRPNALTEKLFPHIEEGEIIGNKWDNPELLEEKDK